MEAGGSASQPGARSATRSLRFVAAARVLARAARHAGLEAPAFRSPPRLVGISRSVSRRPGGGAIVAVLLRGRPWAAVLADMVEGVVAANRLRGVEADRCRTALWAALDAPEAATPAASDRAAAAKTPHAA